MIIANGTIEKKIKSGGGFNEAGYPIKPTVEWSNPIQCQFRANNYSNKGRSNGEAFTMASFEILIEDQHFDAEQLRLTDSRGRVLGEFSVISVEPLTAVCQIKILV